MNRTTISLRLNFSYLGVKGLGVFGFYLRLALHDLQRARVFSALGATPHAAPPSSSRVVLQERFIAMEHGTR